MLQISDREKQMKTWIVVCAAATLLSGQAYGWHLGPGGGSAPVVLGLASVGQDAARSTQVSQSSYKDYSPYPMSQLVEWYHRFETNLLAGTNYNTGAASMLAAEIRKKADRSILPFLYEKSLSPATPPKSVRPTFAIAYADLATADECAAFLPEALAIDDEDKMISGWRCYVTPVCLDKIEAATAKGELSGETLNLLVTKLLVYTQSQSVYSSGDCEPIDRFLNRHCDGYSTSRQRLVMWTTYLNFNGQSPWGHDLVKKFNPIKESLEAIPSKKRVDLHGRFPGLPQLPEDPEEPEEPEEPNARPAWPVWAGIAAAGAVAVGILHSLRKNDRRR
jgi:hypothetical protein